MISEAKIEKIADKAVEQFIENTPYGVNEVMIDGIREDIISAITISVEENDDDIFEYVGSYMNEVAVALQSIDFYAAAKNAYGEDRKQ